MSRNGQIWADGVQFIQTLTWISTATTTSTTNSGAYPYTLYVYIYVYVHESIDSTAKTNNNTQQPSQSNDRCNKSESLNWIRQLTFILFYRLCPGNCNFEHSLWLSPELTWPTATRPRPSSPGPGSHPWPGSDLWRPGVTDTGHSPSSPATLPYSVSPLTPQHSSKYCTIFWNKDKTTGSFTINIPKILSYCCTIYSDHLSLF